MCPLEHVLVVGEEMLGEDEHIGDGRDEEQTSIQAMESLDFNSAISLVL